MITVTKDGQVYDLTGDRLPIVTTLPSAPDPGDVVWYKPTESILVYYGPILGWKPPWNVPWGLQAWYRNVTKASPFPTNDGSQAGSAIADGLGSTGTEEYTNISTYERGLGWSEETFMGSHPGGVALPANRRIQVTVDIARVDGWPTTGHFVLRRGLNTAYPTAMTVSNSDHIVGVKAASSGDSGLSVGMSLSWLDTEIPGPNTGYYGYALFSKAVDGEGGPWFVLSPPASLTVTDLGPAANWNGAV